MQNFDSWWLSVCNCFDKNTVWVHSKAFASGFTSVVLIRRLPGALNSFSSAMTSLFCFAKNAYSFAKLDSLQNN